MRRATPRPPALETAATISTLVVEPTPRPMPEPPSLLFRFRKAHWPLGALAMFSLSTISMPLVMSASLLPAMRKLREYFSRTSGC